MPLSFSADNVGPLCQTARDCAVFMREISGYDPKDPTSAKEPVPDYEAMLDGDIQGMKIGIPTNYFFDDIDTEVFAAFSEACKVLEARGAILVPVTIPHMDAVATYGGIMSRVEGGTIHAEWMRKYPESYAVHLSARLYGSYGIPAVYYIEAQARRGPILKAIGKAVFDEVRVFITPTLRMKVPTLLATDIDAGTPGRGKDLHGCLHQHPAINYMGLPSVSVPCGFDSNGLPIGFQIQGRPFAEGTVLKVADAFQRETDWHKRAPCWRERTRRPLGAAVRASGGDLVDSRLFFRRENPARGGDIRLHLLGLRRPGDHAGNNRLGEQPREGEFHERFAARGAEIREFFGLRPIAFREIAIGEALGFRQARIGGHRRVALVLARESPQASGK